jgi:2'-5' RNA ligase
MQRVSYWLMPAGPDRETLSQVIRELAARYDAPMFDPHVTIYSGPLQESDAVPEIVSETAAAFSSFALSTTGIAHSEQFTKTLFIELAGNDVLTRLSRRLKQEMSTQNEYELKPHLSLIYAALPTQAREQLEHELRIPQRIRFDSIRAIRHQRTTTRRDVEAWETVGEAQLRN